MAEVEKMEIVSINDLNSNEFEKVPTTIKKKKGDRTYSRRAPVVETVVEVPAPVIENVVEERVGKESESVPKKQRIRRKTVSKKVLENPRMTLEREFRIPSLNDLPRLRIKYKPRNLDPEERKRRDEIGRLRILLFKRTRRAIMRAMVAGQDPNFLLLEEISDSNPVSSTSCPHDKVMFEELVKALKDVKIEDIEKYFQKEKERGDNYRKNRFESLTEEGKKEWKRKRALLRSTLGTPEQREERLTLLKQRYRMRVAAMSPEELDKWREHLRAYQRKYNNKKKIIPRSEWSEEEKAKAKERWNRRLAAETPEERQRRLDRYKINQKRRWEIIKLEKTGLSKEDAVAQLKESRHELFPEGLGKGRKIVKNRPYQPRELNNHNSPRGWGRPIANPEELQMITEARERRQRLRLQITSLLNKDLATVDASSENAQTRTKSTSSASNSADISIDDSDNDSVVEVKPTVDVSDNTISCSSRKPSVVSQNGMIASEESDNQDYSTLSNTKVYENLEDQEIDFSSLEPGLILEFEDEFHDNNESSNEPETDVEHFDPDNNTYSDHEDVDVDQENPTSVEPSTLQATAAVCTENDKAMSEQNICKATPEKSVTLPTNIPTDFFCKLCNKSFRSKGFLYCHNVTRHKVKKQSDVFACPFPHCTSKFPNSYFVWRHYIKLHDLSKNKWKGSRSLAHQIASITAPPKQNDDMKHLQVSSICPFCGKHFALGKSVERHIKEVHSEDDASQKHCCDQCGKSFKQKCTLDDHIRRVHLGLKNLCDMCGREFQSPVKLWKHKVDVHEMKDLDPSSVPGVKIKSCTVCGVKMFRGMTAHVQKKHPEEMKNLRMKAWSNNRHANGAKHYETRKQKPRVPCEYCDKTFGCANAKRIHIHRFHSTTKDDETQKCDVCVRVYKSEFDLIIHYLRHHVQTYHFKLKPEDGETLNCHFCSSEMVDKNLYKLHILSEHKDLFLKYFKETKREFGKPRRRSKKTGIPRRKTKTSSINGEESPIRKRQSGINKRAERKSKVSKREASPLPASLEPLRRSQRKRIPNRNLQNNSYDMDLEDENTLTPSASGRFKKCIKSHCPDKSYLKYFEKFPQIEWKIPVLQIKRLH